MRRELKEKLVAALRSGAYRQTHHELVSGFDCFCASGLAGKLAGCVVVSASGNGCTHYRLQPPGTAIFAGVSFYEEVETEHKRAALCDILGFTHEEEMCLYRLNDGVYKAADPENPTFDELSGEWEDPAVLGLNGRAWSFPEIADWIEANMPVEG